MLGKPLVVALVNARWPGDRDGPGDVVFVIAGATRYGISRQDHDKYRGR